MSFSQKYLEKCFGLRSRWRRKRTQIGDWYLDSKRISLGVAAESDLARIRFSDDFMTYIPDIDDLMELIDLQVAAWGDDPRTKKMDLKYEPERGWTAVVEYAERTTMAVGESLHATLLVLYFQMVAPAPKER